LTKAKNTPAGFLAFTLHAHLPYVVNHGTWPHGMEWLHEAAAETYLPLLRVLGNLERDGVPANFNISLSPILLEQLAHPFFIAEFPRYLTRKIARRARGRGLLHPVRRHPPHRDRALLGPLLFRRARRLQRARRQHHPGLSPLQRRRPDRDPHLRRDPRLHAPARHRRERSRPGPHRRRHPRPPPRQAPPRHLGAGVRLPSRRLLELPRPLDGGSATPSRLRPHRHRAGALRIQSRLLLRRYPPGRRAAAFPRRTARRSSRLPRDPQPEQATQARSAASTSPTTSTGPTTSASPPPSSPRSRHRPAGLVRRHRLPRRRQLPRLPQEALPRRPPLLAGHRSNGRHRRQARLLAATGRRAREGARQPLRLPRLRALESGFNDRIPPVLCSPFDAELFGHWWFEGPMWLEAVCRTLHDHSNRHRHHHLQPISRSLSPRRLHRHARRLLGRGGQSPGLDEPGDLLDLRPTSTPPNSTPARSAPRASGASPSWASASRSSSAANCCCSNPPTGSSSSPPALRATTPRCAS
jgi:hypothetical protein